MSTITLADLIDGLGAAEYMFSDGGIEEDDGNEFVWAEVSISCAGVTISLECPFMKVYDMKSFAEAIVAGWDDGNVLEYPDITYEGSADIDFGDADPYYDCPAEFLDGILRNETDILEQLEIALGEYVTEKFGD